MARSLLTFALSTTFAASFFFNGVLNPFPQLECPMSQTDRRFVNRPKTNQLDCMVCVLRPSRSVRSYTHFQVAGRHLHCKLETKVAVCVLRAFCVETVPLL